MLLEVIGSHIRIKMIGNSPPQMSQSELELESPTSPQTARALYCLGAVLRTEKEEQYPGDSPATSYSTTLKASDRP
jgi:hypothetical protein